MPAQIVPVTRIKQLQSNGIMIIMINTIIMVEEGDLWVNRFQLSRSDKNWVKF